LDDNDTNNTYNILFNLVFVGDNLHSLDVSSEECFYPITCTDNQTGTTKRRNTKKNKYNKRN